METLLYVSASRLEPTAAAAAAAEIVKDSIRRNADRGLSGAIIFTGTHFARILEGAPCRLDALLNSLQADERHNELCVLARYPISERRFANWRMAYAGPSRFIGRHISRALGAGSPAELRLTADWLTDMMQESVAR